MGGTTSIQIANGYHKTIFVKCATEREYVTMDNYIISAAAGGKDGASISGGGGASYDWNKITSGFSKILPHKYLEFDVDCEGKNTVYVSIVAEDGEKICDAIPKHENHPVLVDTDGQLRDVEDGEIWKPKSK